ncbi:MAG TPA: hypothetical protein VF104_07080 [Burkholderiales bacterium]
MDVYRPDERVYDPTRGMVPASPQQNYVEWLLSQLDPRNLARRARLEIDQAERNRAARAAGGATADPIVEPPMATGGLPYVAPVPPHGPIGSDVLPPLGGVSAGMSGTEEADALRRASGGAPLPPLGSRGSASLPPLVAPGTQAPRPPAVLGGNDYNAGANSFTGGGGTVVNTAPHTAVGGLGTVGGVGGLGDLSGPRPINAAAAEKLYTDETGMAIRQGFQDAGIDSFKNPYAQSVIRRYAPILPQLMEFFAIANGQDINDTASMATWVPQFIKSFMSGEVNPQRLIQHALDIAEQNPVLKQYLIDQGPNGLLQLQGQTSGYGQRVEGARQRVIRERLARQQMAELQNPASPDVDEATWLKIVQGR